MSLREGKREGKMVLVNLIPRGDHACVPESDQRIAGELRARLLAHGLGCIRRIILYGSRARGPALPDSDFDLLVIETDPVSKREEMQRLHRAVHNLPYPVDVWGMGEQEFEETKHVIGGLAYPAHKYGVVLYENA
jgi:predicted nucleotidyltransferase